MHKLFVGKIIPSEYVLRMAVNHYFYAQIKDYRYAIFNLCIEIIIHSHSTQTSLVVLNESVDKCDTGEIA